MKKLIGIVVIIGLLSIVLVNIFNQVDEKQTEQKLNEIDVSGETGAKGAAIVPEGQAGIAEGQIAPDFELMNLAGEYVNLSDYKGKKVVLNFWATWCPPCKAEMPELQKYHEKYQADVAVLAVNLTKTEKTPKDVHHFIEKGNYTYPVLLDADSAVSNGAYKAIIIPTTYFIDENGRIGAPKKSGPMTYDYLVEVMDTLK